MNSVEWKRLLDNHAEDDEHVCALVKCKGAAFYNDDWNVRAVVKPYKDHFLMMKCSSTP